MTWFKVDDRLHANRKPRKAGNEAMGLWVRAGSWVADELMDGFVPREQCFAWASNADELAARLVDAGLWEPAVHEGEEGWRFHDWHVFQPSREDVESRREYEREKKRRKRSSPQGTTGGNPQGSPGTGIASDQRDIPYPDSPGLSPRDKIARAHTFELDEVTGACARCGTPQVNAVHRVLFVVDAVGL